MNGDNASNPVGTEFAAIEPRFRRGRDCWTSSRLPPSPTPELFPVITRTDFDPPADGVQTLFKVALGSPIRTGALLTQLQKSLTSPRRNSLGSVRCRGSIKTGQLYLAQRKLLQSTLDLSPVAHDDDEHPSGNEVLFHHAFYIRDGDAINLGRKCAVEVQRQIVSEESASGVNRLGHSFEESGERTRGGIFCHCQFSSGERR